MRRLIGIEDISSIAGRSPGHHRLPFRKLPGVLPVNLKTSPRRKMLVSADVFSSFYDNNCERRDVSPPSAIRDGFHSIV
jgi:hypothetical protein